MKRETKREEEEEEEGVDEEMRRSGDEETGNSAWECVAEAAAAAMATVQCRCYSLMSSDVLSKLNGVEDEVIYKQMLL
ncbi:hypothetical protein NQZ68_017978 [Dissostichus eleginoides]|nr:hypothetical protein NQZ68_017978 [Dissostichus eleginoides]